MSPADHLTPSQRAAVECIDGPLLVLAGPGSGKTRVVTHRIAHLVEQGVPPHQILAITFTNKAAGEMADRVGRLLPGARVQVSTFHRFCARLLRRYASVVGLQPNYTILDAADQKQVLRRVINELDLDTVHYSPEKVGYRISTAKNDLRTSEDVQRQYEESIADHWQAVIARVYPAYQRWLLESNSVDFDDLLLHVAMMLVENPELRQELDSRFRYILVDEYQDTNAAQYQIIAALSQEYPNLCVTGDPDQSIYGWRGARIENILRFEREYPDAQVVRLEQNFRSTQAILRSADRLIGHNTQRKAKRLLTDNEEGDAVELLEFTDAHDEADGLARRIRELVESGGATYGDVAVFYRVNALSRQLELALLRHRVPFQVAAGVAFYDRAEIKDALSYLRLIYNPNDRSAFLRVVNTPLRGLGETSQRRLVAWAADNGVNFLEAAARAKEIPRLTKRAIAGFERFARLMGEFSLADAGSVEKLLLTVLDRTGFTRPWEGSLNEQDQQRLANVQELVTAARQFDAVRGDEPDLEAFLEQTSLVNETDSLDPAAGQVTLMTLHAAKGLEFPHVYILGVEEGLLPHERAVRDAGKRELEEERRLLFVGMTRAERRLWLTQTVTREFRGRTLHTIPSTFLAELEYNRVDASAGGDLFPEWQAVPQPAEKKKSLPRNAEGKLDFGGAGKITTAANLLNGSSEAVELPRGFAMGMRVRHPRYGVGTVTEVGGFGARRTVTVRFAEADRVEKFVAAKAPLQPLGT
ncbi:ATP-dependent DNA helicase PcrA [Maioricimonas rarisocia]|uniref:DNA 3'-5' helicase n=1 Tax=Maioricimonas rarisocia TaxID=2528026 RepID=A0A517Z6N5_9PLAN|nr:UvrD-helicase domain-containing protein [Maioricimonas rarisocia]QDU38160.1 ATP-dependent DNA helicase PcrA [Maioricimonas rarisocia]